MVTSDLPVDGVLQTVSACCYNLITCVSHMASHMACHMAVTSITRSNAIQRWVARLVRCSDAGHMSTMWPRVNHNGQHIPFLIDIAHKVAAVLITECAKLTLCLVVSQGLEVCQEAFAGAGLMHV